MRQVQTLLGVFSFTIGARSRSPRPHRHHYDCFISRPPDLDSPHLVRAPVTDSRRPRGTPSLDQMSSSTELDGPVESPPHDPGFTLLFSDLCTDVWMLSCRWTEPCFDFQARRTPDVETSTARLLRRPWQFYCVSSSRRLHLKM